METETLTFTGDTVKALGDGRVGGYLVRFTDAKNKDLAGEFFTAKTYYGPRDGDGNDCLFHHSLPIKGVDQALTDHIFAPIKTRKDSIGIFAETVLNMADEYERKISELVDAGKLGWSSGAAAHTVRKSAEGELTRWPIVEGSLTPTPCESQNLGGVRPIKSLTLDDFTAIAGLKDVMTIKDVMTTGDGYAPQNNRGTGTVPPPVAPAPMRPATGEPNEKNDDAPARDSGSAECPACHLHCHFDADHRECPYCGQTLTLSAEGVPLAGKSFGDELDAALAAVESCANRADALKSLRVKEGRTLSSSTQGKLQDLSERLIKLLASIKPEDLDALQAQRTVIELACMEAQMAVYEAQRAADLTAMLDALDD